MRKPLLWLSFVDHDLPPGKRNLGIIIIRADDVIDASRKTHAMGINPGGEVMCVRLPETPAIPAKYLNRLLTRDEAEELNQRQMKLNQRSKH